MEVNNIGILATGGLEVQTTRVLRIGMHLKINPSEGYLGIESGNIKIDNIIDGADVPKLDRGTDVYKDIQEFADVYLSLFSEGDYDDYNDAHTRLFTQPWIVYSYSNSDTYVLPLEEFLEHTMIY